MAPYKTRRVAAAQPLPAVRGGAVGGRAARGPGERVRGAHHRAPGRPGRGPLGAGGAGRAGAASRRQHHVTLTHPPPGDFAGTFWLEAAGDTQDLSSFYALVCAEAKRLGRLGDTDDYETRKAKAPAGRRTPGHPRPHRRTGRPACAGACAAHLYVHVSLAVSPPTPPANPVGEVEKLGPRPSTSSAPAARVERQVLPVLDLNRTDAVDQHDPPPWMRQQVILRDQHCIFPWCGRDARSCDLDHIVPYVPPVEGGPPGQTNPQNLAPLAGDITGPRPSPAGPTNATATAPTPGPAPTGARGPSDPTEPTARPRPHPPRQAEPRRTPSPPEGPGADITAHRRVEAAGLDHDGR